MVAPGSSDMHELDDTDLEILSLLVEDARRPFSEIAEKVGVSPPTVSDRIDRLQELGVVRRFTVDIDQSQLDDGLGVLLELSVEAGRTDDVADDLSALNVVEHVFATASGRIVAHATVPDRQIDELLVDEIEFEYVEEYEVQLLTRTEWQPVVSGTAFAVDCDECGNSVTSQGESARIDGELYTFCCSSCRSNFEEEYEPLVAESA